MLKFNIAFNLTENICIVGDTINTLSGKSKRGKKTIHAAVIYIFKNVKIGMSFLPPL